MVTSAMTPNNSKIEPDSAEALQELFAYQSSRLIAIVDQISIYPAPGDEALKAKLDELVAVHRLSLAEIEQALNGVDVTASNRVPAAYAHLHYVSIRCVLPIILNELATLIEKYQHVLAKLPARRRLKTTLETFIDRTRQLVRETNALLAK